MPKCKECFWFVPCALGEAKGFCLFHCKHVNPNADACELFVKSKPRPTCIRCKHFVRTNPYEGICTADAKYTNVFTPACEKFEEFEDS